MKGDKTKQPTECRIDEENKCLNMKCSYEGYDKETYRCDICGESYNLYYYDMQ
jgi:hypothetical protein